MTEYVFIINPHAPLFVICRSADQRGLCSFSALSPHWSCRPTTSPNDSLWNFLGRFYSIGRTLTWWRGISLMRLTWRWWWICCGIRARTFSLRRSMCSRLVRFTEIINGRTVLMYPCGIIWQVFVANPKKPPQIENILRRNKDKLLAFLKNFHNDKEGASIRFHDMIFSCWRMILYHILFQTSNSRYVLRTFLMV